jgi:hypothetical protein
MKREESLSLGDKSQSGMPMGSSLSLFPGACSVRSWSPFGERPLSFNIGLSFHNVGARKIEESESSSTDY